MPPAVLATMTAAPIMSAGRFSASALLGLAHCFCAGKGNERRGSGQALRKRIAPS
jgi:hypothetical protein